MLFLLLTIILLLALPLRAQAAHPLDTLKPGEWFAVSNSHLRAVEKKPTEYPDYTPTTGSAQYDAIRGISGLGDLIGAWGGGAYDTQRERLLVHGGGHAGYAGNEVYAFDLATLTWSRLTDPHTYTDKEGRLNACQYPDAQGQVVVTQPRSAHTYSHLQYVPELDSLCHFAAAALYPKGETSSCVSCLSLTTKTWTAKRNAPHMGFGAYTAYDPVLQQVWQHGNASSPSSALARWHPLTDIWSVRTDNYSQYNYYRSAAIDPVRHRLVAVGAADADGGIEVFELGITDRPIPRQLRVSSGDQWLEGQQAPGFAWDGTQFVGWAGGTAVYVLDPVTYVWTKHTAASTNTVTPSQAAPSGTFGRWQYSAKHKVFVVVNSVDESVWIYKLAGSTGIPVPPVDTKPNAPTGMKITIK